ncbi:hypothetical protein [Sphingomonas sp.]|jgi:hypothetical protein|uniref:hypothetical protein n=1 Tax=Sphingomonas sp. TaxID=28214 RepID=UPI002E366EAB|nr:hypothetical protein [Sphingomonas sp.]HEX4694464.1 hypothetical protein [Sphingomonas sp.]
MMTFNDHLRQFASAARRLVQDDWVDAEAGRYSQTVYMCVKASDSLEEQAAVAVASEQGLSLLVLQFGTGSAAKGPRCCTVVGRAADGSAVVARDCALFLGDWNDPMTIVTRGPDADGHFVSVEGQLEHRPGRAASLTGGIIRAGRLLADTARNFPADDEVGFYGISTL